MTKFAENCTTFTKETLYRKIHFMCSRTAFLKEIYFLLMRLKILKLINFITPYIFSVRESKHKILKDTANFKVYVQISRNNFSKMKQTTLNFFTFKSIIAATVSTATSKDTSKYSSYQSNYEFCNS